MTEDQVEELMKAFAQADKVSHYMYVTLIESETFVVFRKQFNYIRIVTINEILIITLLQITMHINIHILRMVMEFSQLRSTRQLSMNTESL